MKYIHLRSFQIGWFILLTVLLLGLFVTPAGATSRGTTHQKLDPTSIAATIYLSTGTLQPIFQSQIDGQVPGMVNSAIASIVSKLPPEDRESVTLMAQALVQPSATLVSLVPQQNGLATTLSISLYAGDPKPMSTSMLVSFKAADAYTIAVSAQALGNTTPIVTGPLATFKVPIGQLNSIATTPGCGDSALGVNLQFPVSLSQAQVQGQPAAYAAYQQSHNTPLTTSVQSASTSSLTSKATTANPTDAFIEIPSASLAQLGSVIGSFAIDSNLTAKNIKIGVEGSNIVFSSDVYLGSSFRLATARTTVAPYASNGNLAVHVLNTDVTIFQIFTFPYNTYNSEIEQMLNARLNGALAGNFTVTQAAIGPSSQLPCASSDSLVLTGNTTLV